MGNSLVKTEKRWSCYHDDTLHFTKAKNVPSVPISLPKSRQHRAGKRGAIRTQEFRLHPTFL